MDTFLTKVSDIATIVGGVVLADYILTWLKRKKSAAPKQPTSVTVHCESLHLHNDTVQHGGAGSFNHHESTNAKDLK